MRDTVEIALKYLCSPDAAGYSSTVVYCISNVLLTKAMRFLKDRVDFRLKIVDLYSRVLFPLVGAYTSNPHASFNRPLLLWLGGYKMGRVPFKDTSSVQDLPVGTVEKDEVYIPSHIDGFQIKLRIYNKRRKEGDVSKQPMLLHYHGGGFVISHVDSLEYDQVCSDFASMGGYCVVSVEYRLAPENPFPCALDDSYTALLWCQSDPKVAPARNHRLLQYVDTENQLFVGGDSAGGNIAAVMSHLVKNKVDSRMQPAVPISLYPLVSSNNNNNNVPVSPHIHKLLLVYPSCGCRSSFWSGPYYRDHGYILSGKLIDFFTDMYKPKHMDLDAFLADPRVSPLMNSDFTGLPPTVLVTAEHDQLVDECKEYYRNIVEAGGTCVHIHVRDTAHAFWGCFFLSEYRSTFLQVLEAMSFVED